MMLRGDSGGFRRFRGPPRIPQEDTADCGLRKSFAEPTADQMVATSRRHHGHHRQSGVGAAFVFDVRNWRLLFQANHAGSLLRQCGRTAGGRAGAAQWRGYRQRLKNSYCSGQRQTADSRANRHEGEHKVQFQSAPRYRHFSRDCRRAGRNFHGYGQFAGRRPAGAGWRHASHTCTS